MLQSGYKSGRAIFKKEKIMKKSVAIETLKGKTIEKAELDANKEKITFYCTDKTVFEMYHEQDCCESVNLEDGGEDLHYLNNSKVLNAYETNASGEKGDGWGSETWTFYIIRTEKDSITLRWYGESNGYYSEDVSFVEVLPDEPMYKVTIQGKTVVQEFTYAKSNVMEVFNTLNVLKIEKIQ